MSVKSDEEKKLVLPDEFPFPYERPYDIQLNFMKALYKTLELKKVGIFESPTGTVIEEFSTVILFIFVNLVSCHYRVKV